MKKGVQQGKQQQALAIAKNLLDLLDDRTVADKTGLTAEGVAALRREQAV